MEYISLNNGVKMPILGYGVYQVTKEECERCVLDALKVGYRAIDTAQSYFNEEEVGNAIQKSGIPREEIFLTTKVWIEHYGYEEAKKSVLESMKKLKTDYLDLVLLHQPFSDAYGAYHALEELYDEGKIRAIGISNFYVDRMVDFASFNRIKPMVNQVETHIFNQQKEMKKMLVVYYSWSNRNTKRIAEQLTNRTGADIARIETAEPYSGSHEDVVEQGKREVEAGFMPQINPISVNLADYDVIAIGTPTWWYTMAPAVLTFLTVNDFTGKTVIPFMTNGGWPGHVIKDMKDKCKGAAFAHEMQIQFDSMGKDHLETSEDVITEWIGQIKMEINK